MIVEFVLHAFCLIHKKLLFTVTYQLLNGTLIISHLLKDLTLTAESDKCIYW